MEIKDDNEKEFNNELEDDSEYVEEDYENIIQELEEQIYFDLNIEKQDNNKTDTENSSQVEHSQKKGFSYEKGYTQGKIKSEKETFESGFKDGIKVSTV